MVLAAEVRHSKAGGGDDFARDDHRRAVLVDRHAAAKPSKRTHGRADGLAGGNWRIRRGAASIAPILINRYFFSRTTEIIRLRPPLREAAAQFVGSAHDLTIDPHDDVASFPGRGLGQRCRRR